MADTSSVGETERLRALAGAVREAICVARQEFPDYLRKTFATFPKDTCRFASILLSLYLLEHGYTNVQVVYNGCRNGKWENSHAWVQVGTTIVDITATQFDPDVPAVLVTEDHQWHNQFWGQQSQPAAEHFREHQAKARQNLTDAYEAIKRHLP